MKFTIFILAGALGAAVDAKVSKKHTHLQQERGKDMFTDLEYCLDNPNTEKCIKESGGEVIKPLANDYIDDYVPEEWNENAAQDVKKMIKGSAKPQINEAKKELMKDIKGILNDSRKDVRATKTDMRVLSPKLGKAKGDHKRAQDTLEQAQADGADNIEELTQAEQDAMAALTDLQSQFDQAKAKKSSYSDAHKEFAADVKSFRSQIMTEDFDSTLKDKIDDVKKQALAVTDEASYDAFKAGAFVDLEAFIQSELDALLANGDEFRTKVEELAAQGASGDRGTTITGRLLANITEVPAQVPTLEEVLNNAMGLFMQ